jgi:hypothetical protein
MDGPLWHALETVVSEFVRVLSIVGTPALILALGSCAWRVSRAVLLQRAGSAALKGGSEDDRREAALEIVKSLTGENEPWYKAILPWRRPGDGEP